MVQYNNKMLKYAGITFIFVSAIVFGGYFANAQSASELRNKISDYNKQIEALDAEIRAYEQELLKVGAEKQTLQKAIDELNLARKKLSTDISKTENQISKTNLTIEQLASEIYEK